MKPTDWSLYSQERAASYMAPSLAWFARCLQALVHR